MLAMAKRILRPVRPVLLPVWQRVAAVLVRGTERDYRRYITAAPESARRQRTTVAGPAPAHTGGIRPLTRSEFDAATRDRRYYRERWSYMDAAARIAANLIERNGLRSVLELGAHAVPLVHGADVFDLRPSVTVKPPARVVKGDARVAPWPFEDRAYDLFVALQVFEHLGDRQREAFVEVRRIARHAILSLPIEWEMVDPADCHHRVPHARALEWFHPVVPSRVELGNPGPKMRLIYVFEDLPPPDTVNAGVASGGGSRSR